MNGARTTLPARRWRRLATIPGDVAALGVLVLVAGVCCLLGALFPISDQAPVELGRVLGIVALVVGAALLVVGARAPRWALHATVVFVTLSASVLISQSATNGGLMMTAWGFAWTAVYVGFFFPPRAIVVHVALMTVGCVAGIVVAAVPGTLVEAAIMTVTLWTAGIAMGSISARLRAQADYDHLTGLLNRNGFTKAADRELAIAARSGYPLALAIVDLDDFKGVNDTHGHAAGDQLLAELAAAWQGTLRPGDLVARMGGDEFVVLFPATGPDDARGALARLRGAHGAGWSVGLVEWQRGETLADCLARADAQLYLAKRERDASTSAS